MTPRTRFIITSLVSVALGAGFVRLSSGCLDITPIVVPPHESGAVVEGEPCITCLQAKCSPTLDTCVADPRCSPVYDCIRGASCLDLRIIDDKITCILPCLQEAGIVSVQDPTVDLLLTVVQCGQSTCTIECNLGDGGVGVDIDAL